METVSSKVLIEHWHTYQKDRHANPELYKLRSTGLRGLDHILGGGVEYGNMVIYGGAQKIGKSTLLQCTAEAFGRRGEPFIYFSGEMTNDAMATRLVCSISGVDKGKVRRIQLDDVDWNLVESAEETIAKFQGWWNYGFSNIHQITNILSQTEKEAGVDIRVMFVDYIQLMEHPGKRTRSEEIEALSHAFKRMSVGRGKPMLIFIAAQLNRQSIRGQIVDANAFLGSGALERDMDVGVIITAAKDETGRVLENYRELVVVGSRETGVDRCRIRFNGSTSSLADADVISQAVNLDYWGGGV
jgi:replicative DNA helicase